MVAMGPLLGLTDVLWLKTSGLVAKVGEPWGDKWADRWAKLGVRVGSFIH